MFDNTMHIAIAEARHALKGVEGTKAMLEAAMDATRDHWMVVDDNKRFSCAVGAVMVELGDTHPDYDILRREMAMLNALGAAMGGLPINFNAMEPVEDAFGIGAMWAEGKKAA